MRSAISEHIVNTCEAFNSDQSLVKSSKPLSEILGLQFRGSRSYEAAGVVDGSSIGSLRIYKREELQLLCLSACFKE